MTNFGTIHIFAEAGELEQKIKEAVPPAPEGMVLVLNARTLEPGVAVVAWRHEIPTNKPAAIYGVPAAGMPVDFVDGSGETWRISQLLKEG